MIRCYFVYIFLTISTYLVGQTTIDWVTLSDVTFEQKFDEEVGLNYDEATFGETVQSFEKQEIKISGYIIPLDALGISYALSRNPNSSCFFCGGAGPETVVELKVKPSAMKRHKMDDIKTFKGILHLNVRNDKSFTYVLRQAEDL